MGAAQATLLRVMDSLLDAALVTAPVKGVYRVTEHPGLAPAARKRRAAADADIGTAPKLPRGPGPAAAEPGVVVDQHTLAERAYSVKVGRGNLGLP